MLEGKYWKRKPEAVASEYRKWRYYREKNVRVMLVVLCQISRGSSLWVSSAIITSLVIGLGARCSTGM